MCRLKKVRCEGGSPSRKACNNCINGKYDCTYIQTAKVEARDKAYVQSLETRLVKMEELLRRVIPENDLSQSLSELRDPQPSASVVSPLSQSAQHRATPPADDVDSDDEELAVRQTLEEKFKHISLDPGRQHYVGKSSNLVFIQTAVDFQEGSNSERKSDSSRSQTPTTKLPFFDSPPWISQGTQDEALFIFPEYDLIHSLASTFFAEVNIYWPLLHRPTFERSLKEELHLRDEGFGALLLLVCALGARYSKDPRVYVNGKHNPQAAGLEWFNQVQRTMKVINMDPPRIYDLQAAFLASSFLHGLAAPQASWPIMGYGFRLAQAMGAHRRKVYSGIDRSQGELLKRAFWLIIKTDRDLGAALGRPTGIQEEDFDCELPQEVDDEYWDTGNPATDFKQPEDQPSTVAYFNQSVKLSAITSSAMQTIYSTSKSKSQAGRGTDWEERNVIELDSALNSWIDALPDHLRFDPAQENLVFFNQSALLYSSYYNLQISIHRPFLSQRRSQSSSLPSLAICTNAARSCLHVMWEQYKRARATDTYQIPQINGLFASGMVLLLNILGAKGTSLSANANKDIGHVHKAIEMLKALEPWWHFAGRLGDALTELARAGDLPLPNEDPCDKVKAFAEGTATAAARESSIPSEASSTLRDSQSPASSTTPAYAASNTPEYASAAGSYEYLPVRSEDLSRQPYQYDYNREMPAYPVDTFAEYPAAAPAWTYSPSAPAPQDVAAQHGGPFHSGPAAPDGFLRTLAGGFMQAAQGVPTPADGAGGENMLGMWSNMSGNMQWDEWGNYFAHLQPQQQQQQQQQDEQQQWHGR
ncbi:fungal-specific transcription factor domain-containing protein [Phanerochaete sordida]|uniref:Fungal-specific transcription factor domain-containing protein n=1 Tax=Phanerochaete sordida TaxID=48140 RepID=A0A9P3G477_9APHY|nr:fungal-specific transcription factor domain-containing protein [Phanerochaete sordida]